MGKALLFCMFVLAATTLLHASPFFTVTVNRCRELLKILPQIMQHVNTYQAELFHVPEDVNDGCVQSALTCFRSQVNKLQEANGQNKLYFKKLLNKVHLPFHNKKGCTPCSNYTTHKPDEFLKSMQTMLQRIVNKPEILREQNHTTDPASN